jgi:uncharacterized protein
MGSFSIAILTAAAKRTIVTETRGAVAGWRMIRGRKTRCSLPMEEKKQQSTRDGCLSVDPAQCRSAATVMGSLSKSESGLMPIPHELASVIEQLGKTNYECGRLLSRYDEVNRNIYRIESEEEPAAGNAIKELKKQRLKLEDEIASFLTKIERRM